MSDRSSLQASEQGFTPVDLGGIAHIEMGQSPDSRYVFEDPFLGHPFLQGNAEFGTVSPAPKYGCTRPAKTAKPGDVLISVRAPVGAVNIADQSYCIGRGLAAISVSGVEPSLAAHLIASQAAALRRVAQGTTFEAISKKDLVALKLRMPPQDELPVIAQILDTLDTAIRETEALIDKLKAVKQGLLHDLLTRGIDANGQLRPPQSEAPQLYKESPLGWIPKGWVVDVIENFLDRIIDYRGKTPEKTESGVPLLTAKNVRLGYVDPEPREFIASESFERWMSRGIPRKGDVLFTTEAPLGNVAQIETYDRLAFAQRMIILQASSRIIDSFLKYLMLGRPFRSRLFALGSGSTVEGIQQSTFRKILIAIPESLAEQNSIVETLIEMDSKISNESTCMEKLRQAKSGLMDDLLTGRVRVTPLLESVQQTAAQTGA